MSLSSALSIAGEGLGVVQAQIAVVSQNVANASTTGYVEEQTSQTSVAFGGQPGGVAAGPTKLALDTTLQGSVLQQNAAVSGLSTRQAALSAIDAVQGSTGDTGSSLSTAVGALQDAFTSLAQDPASVSGQQAVVNAAGSVASSINALSSAYQTQRQAAENAIATAVPQVNAALSQIGQTSDQIIKLQAEGLSTADLENTRNAQMQTLSSLVSVSFAEQPNGDMVVTTSGGATLPTRAATGPLTTTDASLDPSDVYPADGTLAIKLNGVDVTSAMTGGTLGANLQLRDSTLPTFQAQLDEYSQTLASRFQAQGLTLFSDGSGNVPTSSSPPAVVQANYVGFASTIQVNPAVIATPSAVRDGTQDESGGSNTFTMNPSTGPAGFTTLINNVLTYGFGNQQQDGTPQPASATTGLGVSGRLSSDTTGSGGLVNLASDLVASQSAQSSDASSSLSTEQSVQTALQSRFSAVCGVSVDNEMSNLVSLQNAYGANAKVITAIQAMFTTLLNAVTPTS